MTFKDVTGVPVAGSRVMDEQPRQRVLCSHRQAVALISLQLALGEA
ncbi:hypothetical protein ACF8E6_19435 [Pseudomonas sp. xss_1]